MDGGVVGKVGYRHIGAGLGKRAFPRLVDSLSVGESPAHIPPVYCRTGVVYSNLGLKAAASRNRRPLIDNRIGNCASCARLSLSLTQGALGS